MVAQAGDASVESKIASTNFLILIPPSTQNGGEDLDRRNSLHDHFNGSAQEFVNTCIFAGFLSDRLLGPPMPSHLLHVRCRQCFPTFCGSFHVRTWPQLLSGHNPLKGRLKRGSPGTEQLFPNREPVCPKASGRPADPPVRDRNGGHPPVNQSLTSASQRSSG